MPRLVPLLPSVRAQGLDLTKLSDRCATCLPRMTPNDFFSHSTAAMVHGIPVSLALRNDALLHVSVLRPAYPPHTVGIVGHRLRTPVIRSSVRGFPVSDPMTSWCLLGAVISIPDLVAAADYLLGPRSRMPVGASSG